MEITEALLHKVEERVSADLLSQNKKKQIKKQNKELLEQILGMNKTLRELKSQDEKRELEYQKKIEEEAEKIRQETQKSEGEKTRLKIAELEKKLSDTERALI